MRLALTLSCILLATFVLAQQGRELRPIYAPGGSYRSSGWFFSPGAASMLPTPRAEQLTGFDTQLVPDTIFSGEFRRDGRWGLCLEGGRHHFLRWRGPFDHFDYGFSYKMLRGTDEFQGALYGGNSPVSYAAQASFTDSYVAAFANLSNILQVSNRVWFQNALGVNIDYRVSASRGGTGVIGTDWLFPAALPAQLHYKFGIGWKPEPGIFIMPMIETPLLNFNEWEGIKGTLPYFTGRYRPILITLRIQWLSKIPARECEGQPGRQVDLSKEGKHDGGDLFGPDTRKMKRKKKGGVFHFLKRS